MGLKGSRLEEKTRFYAFNESSFASILLASSSQPSLQSLPMGQLCVLHTSDIVPSPMQSFPPYLGAGSEQRRFLLWTPPSQVTVQVFQGDQGPQPPSTKGNNNKIISQRPVLNSRMQRVALALPVKFNSLGQGAIWQTSVCRPSPWQSMPPICGVGELQRRIRVMFPSPQVTEQEDQGDQWLQPPSCLTVGDIDAPLNSSRPQTFIKHNGRAKKGRVAYIACRIPEGSSHGSGQKCLRSCC